ncbi:MAG: hypothetical protein ACYSWQ_05920 [Planctomycetota bacterium]|jgi:hypothetical protein
MKKLTVPLTVALTLSLESQVAAQESSGESADEIAQKLANPNTPLASLNFRLQYRTFEGALPHADPATCNWTRITPLGSGAAKYLAAEIEASPDPKFRRRMSYALERMTGQNGKR